MFPKTPTTSIRGMKRLVVLFIPLLLLIGCNGSSDLEERLEAKTAALKEATEASTPTTTNSTPTAVAQTTTPASTPSSSQAVTTTATPAPPSISENKQDPPYHGTIFNFPNAVNSDDPTAFVEIIYSGKESRQMFDRRQNDWIQDTPHLFIAQYSDGLSIEVQVNSEFTEPDIAHEIASEYAWLIGQLQSVLRKGIETVWIHDGKYPFGGGNKNLLIYIEQGKQYMLDKILEETLIHEASHTSLNWPGSLLDHGKTAGWLAAQQSGEGFISVYAKEHPEREDIAESFLPWLVLRYRLDRISQSEAETISDSIPHRIKYFDQQEFEMYPVGPAK